MLDRIFFQTPHKSHIWWEVSAEIAQVDAVGYIEEELKLRVGSHWNSIGGMSSAPVKNDNTISRETSSAATIKSSVKNR